MGRGGGRERKEEKESGSSVHGSSKVRGLFNRRSAFWRGRYLLNLQKHVGQKELGSCPAVVVEGMEVCGERVRCVGVVKIWGKWDSKVACVMCPHAPL